MVIPEDFEKVDFRNGASGILTWAEVVNGTLSRSSLELLTPAMKLANDLEMIQKVNALGGHNVGHLAQELFTMEVMKSLWWTMRG